MQSDHAIYVCAVSALQVLYVDAEGSTGGVKLEGTTLHHMVSTTTLIPRKF